MSRQGAIGARMIRRKKHFPDKTMAEIADEVWKMKDLPHNPKDGSIGTETAEAYKEELRNNPDKHAQEMLRAIERGEKLEEDPSGS